MPLVRGPKAKTREGFAHNLKTELKANRPKKQALAIAYSEARRGKKDAKKESSGMKKVLRKRKRGEVV